MSNRDTRETLVLNTEEVAKKLTTKEILTSVYDALEARGYNAIDQISGFILSGDPTYITSHNNARALIRQLEREDVIEELVRYYLNKK